MPVSSSSEAAGEVIALECRLNGKVWPKVCLTTRMSEAEVQKYTKGAAQESKSTLSPELLQCNSHKLQRPKLDGRLVGHLKRTRTIRKNKFGCAHCDKSFTYKKFFLAHVASGHNVTRNKCSTCDEGFKYVHQLKGHEMTHSKPFHCETCDKRFGSNRHLGSRKVHKTNKEIRELL